MRAEQTSFLFGANAPFIEELYERYLGDPNAVDAEWRTFFEALGEQKSDVLAEVRGASWAPNGAHVIGAVDPDSLPPAANRNVKGNGAAVPAAIAGKTEEDIRAAARDTSRAFLLIRSYRIRGHLEADLDPLGLVRQAPHRELDPDDLRLRRGRLGSADPDLRHAGPGRSRHAAADHGPLAQDLLRQDRRRIHAHLRSRPEGVDPGAHRAYREPHRVHRRGPPHDPASGVVEAEGLERYLGVKFVGTKRFGLDGGESMIPGIEQILKRGGQLGIRDVVIGMPHRGRLNTLVHVLNKSYTALFSEFQGRSSQPEEMRGSGDVKYHLGASADREFDGTTVHVSLSPNPSHLEAVDPVVLGKARAKQDQRGDTERGQVMAILMHGDAAFAGQGLVAESLDLSDLGGYRIGGTIHFIVNNQIGFTTLPTYSRSGPYCTEVAKIVQAPILHVNGDDPEAVVHVSRIATEFRQHFKRDIVIDMFCYRRHGHNESDEPMFTQPLMYKDDRRPQDGEGGLCRAARSRRRRDAGRGRSDSTRRCARSSTRRWRRRPSTSPTRPTGWRAAGPGFTVAPGEEDRKGATAVELEQLLRGRPRHLRAAQELRPQPQDRAPAPGEAQGHRDRQGHRLGDRRGAGLGHACWPRARRCG